ncbi:Phage related hypothetical protein [Oryzisolibacter propanilivorax]|uniref:Uncharacterized protein n=1 Tax=Oryzisolibacter propanilivorax TaxID=1527607 RepID=A0A1G9UBS6_9BURK|nr:DUF1799 domain-containing protein [Oryzisolibacter propanilivorax]SDM57368.1 Phage related hypothetical protein [Oryzisolibacter propanilivorax]
MAADFALLGLSASEAARASRASQWGADTTASGDFELWPEHQAAWEVFLDCARQWRTASVGMAGLWFQGLDPAAVRLSLAARNVRRADWAGLLGQLRILEDEAAGILNDPS